MKWLLGGLGAAVTASGITYLIAPQPPWWWLLGLLAALFIWTSWLFLS
mgnify:CR=1 FL=1